MTTGKFKVGDVVTVDEDADNHTGRATITDIDTDFNYVVFDGCECENIACPKGQCCNGFHDNLIELAFTPKEQAVREENAQALSNWFNA